ncbi:MAG TPA: SDR family oxidoreductase, partial [Micromonospora sp.]
MVDGLLVTGATGFVGGAVVLELLRTTLSPVVCLVRGQDAAQRLERSLRTAARAYAMPDGFVDEHLPRVRAVAGDLTGDVEELTTAARASGVRVTALWHCAASLKFLNVDRDEIF